MENKRSNIKRTKIYKEHKDCFCNYHCSTNDCPNIQYDMADDKWGYGIADDMGLERQSCKTCGYETYECKDCFDNGTDRCPNRQVICQKGTSV